MQCEHSQCMIRSLPKELYPFHLFLCDCAEVVYEHGAVLHLAAPVLQGLVADGRHCAGQRWNRANWYQRRPEGAIQLCDLKNGL